MPAPAPLVLRYTDRTEFAHPAMGRQPIKLLVTDLDNTLYDWVGYFARAFRAMIGPAAAILEIPEQQLLDELQAVHRNRGDSEHPWSLAETVSARARWPRASNAERITRLDPAFHAFNRVRKQTLRLYPGVESTLTAIHGAGVPIVGHTEASSVNAHWRIRRLGLERLFTRLYTADVGPSPAQTDIPVIPIPREIHKPDPRILREVCTHFGVEPALALYVGDSLTRDVAMARELGMPAAWASYGVEHDPRDWQTLTRITHWTREDVARVEATRERYKDVVPDVELSAFEELLDHFEFGDIQQTRSA